MKRISVILLAVVFGGCASTESAGPRPNDPFFAPIIPELPVDTVTPDGTLFRPELVTDLYSDPRAHRVGDIITVNLRENTTASKSANTINSRESTVELDPIIGFGGNPIFRNDAIQLDLESETEFEGDAQANQSNNLVGNISVTVIQVLPNRNLVVRGEKWLTLNNGDEYIRLTGIIRPQDISLSNDIDSARVANARIQYSGTGTFASSQQQGWLSRFFSSEWWPF